MEKEKVRRQCIEQQERKHSSLWRPMVETTSKKKAREENTYLDERSGTGSDPVLVTAEGRVNQLVRVASLVDRGKEAGCCVGIRQGMGDKLLGQEQ